MRFGARARLVLIGLGLGMTLLRAAFGFWGGMLGKSRTVCAGCCCSV